MTDRLSPLDGTFLELEDADAGAHMHLGALLVFEPLPGGGPPSLPALAEQVADRLPLLPRYRRRLAHPDAGALQWQAWEDDPDFDVTRHLRRAALPAPGGDDELLAWAGQELEHRIDRAHALWEIVVVEGLADGGWGMLAKIHHCLADGVGSVQIAQLLLDVEPRPEQRAFDPVAPARDDGRSLPGLPFVAEVASAALHPRRTARRILALGGLIADTELHGAPTTSFNRPLGPRRALRMAAVPLEDLQAARASLGGTVNDLVLAAVCAGLRGLLLERDEPLPDAGVRAMIPVDVREDRDGAMGNRISSLFIDLPVTVPDARARHRAISEATRAAKSGSAPLGADTLLAVAGIAPPAIHHHLAPLLSGTRLFNLTVTNVPGPPQPLYSLGARMRLAIPIVPLAADHGLGVAVLSYDGMLVFGVCVDPDLLPDVDTFVGALADGIARLLEHAGEPRVLR